MTYREARDEVAQQIDARDAQVLLAHAANHERTWLLAHSNDLLAPEVYIAFRALAARRAAGEPLQYLTGTQEFYGLSLRVTPHVLIPRPETEHLVEAVLLWAAEQEDDRTLRITDVGTGSGAIAIALATHLAGAAFVATDISEEALAVAKENVRTHGCSERVRLMHADLLHSVAPGSFDAVVSNPPYIPLGDALTLQREVVAHEPHTALFAGDDGLDAYRRLIPQAHTALRPHGLLAMEFGFGQRDALAALLASWDNIRFLDDYAGIPRVVLAERAR